MNIIYLQSEIIITHSSHKCAGIQSHNLNNCTTTMAGCWCCRHWGCHCCSSRCSLASLPLPPPPVHCLLPPLLSSSLFLPSTSLFLLPFVPLLPLLYPLHSLVNVLNRFLSVHVTYLMMEGSFTFHNNPPPTHTRVVTLTLTPTVPLIPPPHLFICNGNVNRFPPNTESKCDLYVTICMLWQASLVGLWPCCGRKMCSNGWRLVSS